MEPDNLERPIHSLPPGHQPRWITLLSHRLLLSWCSTSPEPRNNWIADHEGDPLKLWAEIENPSLDCFSQAMCLRNGRVRTGGEIWDTVGGFFGLQLNPVSFCCKIGTRACDKLDREIHVRITSLSPLLWTVDILWRLIGYLIWITGLIVFLR